MGSRDPWREAPAGWCRLCGGQTQGRRSKDEAGSLAASLGFVGEDEV